MDLALVFNVAEAALWFAFAAIIALLGGRVRGLTPRPRAAWAIAFLAFGVSDLIESRTGAWWKPAGLLVYKGVCLAAIAGVGLIVLRNRARGDGGRRDGPMGRGVG